jgi:hypothetical protein
MNNDDLRQLIKQYKKPGARKPTHKPAVRHAPVMNKPRMPQKPASAPRQPVATTDRPLAARGLTSYRYKGRFGWIMIGAKDHEGALNEARRSTDDKVTKENLQVWNGETYVPVTAARPQTQRLDTRDMKWVTMTLRLASRASNQRQDAFEYKGLRIADEPFIAIRSDGPQGTSNRFYIYDIRNGEEAGFARGNQTEIYRALKRVLANSIERAERERKHAIHQAKEEKKEEEARRTSHANNHGPGFYITPFYSIPEIVGGREMDEDLYGAPEGDCLGPFHRDIEDRPFDQWSNAEEWLGPNTLTDVEALYWELWKKLPAKHPPFKLIEAQSRQDALAGRGYVWIVDGLEKGPPPDPRQTGFAWSK